MYNDQSVFVDAFDAPSRGAEAKHSRPRTLAGFCHGTIITTKNGPRMIETLRVGDQILTRDNGFQTLRWMTPRHTPKAYTPVIGIAAGVIGNRSALYLSRGTSVLMTSHDGADQHLVPARHLINDTTIQATTTQISPVISLVLDRHEIILANGAYCETLRVSNRAMGSLPQQQRADLLAHLPLLRITDRAYRGYARPVLPIDQRMGLLRGNKVA